MIKKFTDDPTKSWEERFMALEAHHNEESNYLLDLVEGLLDYNTNYSIFATARKAIKIMRGKGI